MPKRSREADVARAEKHAENRANAFSHDLNNPATPQATKEAIASRLANALADANGNRPHLKLVDELCTSETTAPNTSSDTDDFAKKLDEIFNPRYGSPEWIKDTEDLFSEHTAKIFHQSQSKSLLQKMKPIKPGRHAKESAPGRFKKVWLALGSVASSITVKNSPFSTTNPEELAIISAAEQPLPSRHAKDAANTRPEHTYPERRRSSKNLRAVGAMVATAAVIAGAFFASTVEKSEPYESRREAAARSYEDPSRQPEVESENIADTAPTSENQVMNETQSPGPAETIETPTSFTITIEDDGNIWEATRAELEKINPEVTDTEIAFIVNGIIWFYQLEDANVIQPGRQFTVDYKTMMSLR